MKLFSVLSLVSRKEKLTAEPSCSVRPDSGKSGPTSLPCRACRSAAACRSRRRSLLQMTWTFSLASMLSSPVASRRSWEEISCSEEACRWRPHSSSCRVCSRGRQRAQESAHGWDQAAFDRLASSQWSEVHDEVLHQSAHFYSCLVEAHSEVIS